MQECEAECSLDEVRGMEAKTYFWEKKFSMPQLKEASGIILALTLGCLGAPVMRSFSLPEAMPAMYLWEWFSVVRNCTAGWFLAAAPLLADWTYHRVMPARLKYRWYGILTVCFFACAAISVYAAEMELAAVTGNTVYFMGTILAYPMAFCIQILLLLRFG